MCGYTLANYDLKFMVVVIASTYFGSIYMYYIGNFTENQVTNIHTYLFLTNNRYFYNLMLVRFHKHSFTN